MKMDFLTLNFLFLWHWIYLNRWIQSKNLFDFWVDIYCYDLHLYKVTNIKVRGSKSMNNLCFFLFTNVCLINIGAGSWVSITDRVAREASRINKRRGVKYAHTTFHCLLYALYIRKLCHYCFQLMLTSSHHLPWTLHLSQFFYFFCIPTVKMWTIFNKLTNFCNFGFI